MPTTKYKVRYATIYVFAAGARGFRVTSSPERLTVRVGDVVDFTVVDATGKLPGKVSIKFPDRSPLAEVEPFERWQRVTVRKAKAGLYKYSILIGDDVVFDPLLEVM